MKAEQHIRTVETHDRAGNVVGTKDVVLYASLLSQAHEEASPRSTPRSSRSPPRRTAAAPS